MRRTRGAAPAPGAASDGAAAGGCSAVGSAEAPLRSRWLLVLMEGLPTLQAYEIGKCTSRGPISEVYQARHIESGETVAIKKIGILDVHPALRRECETEVNVLQMLDHPNLIQYHAHFVQDGDLYLVMELASGGTLAQRLQAAKDEGQRLEESVLWRWLYDVAGALAYLHRRRILHRDVKPSHLFLGENGQVKVGDFGLSKAMSTTTLHAFSCVGTPLYMSPEMVRGEAYSFTSDVWSLGCSLYELAVGVPPFFRIDKDLKALGTAICTANYPALPVEVWSQEFIDLVRDILAVHPDHRPSSQRILDIASCKMVSRIQDFNIMGTIGRGKFSTVHRSLWKVGGDREVALKRIQIFEMDAEARRECSMEVNMLKRLEHTTIIKYLDSFTENSELVIVLELAAHGDLAHLCRQLQHDKRHFSEPQVWGIFFQVSDALHHMHKIRIMHRDIKPANIFMCQRGVVKLGDLGLGRYFSSNTFQAHSVVGTPFYMSPEVITGDGGYDFKSDVWGLGCVLYELTTLICPFAMPGLNYYILGNKIKNAEYPPLPEATPERICSLVEQVLRAQQVSRLDTATVWVTSGRNLLEAERASAAPRRSAKQLGSDDSTSSIGDEDAQQQPGDAAWARRRLARAAAVVRCLLESGPSPSKPPRLGSGYVSGLVTVPHAPVGEHHRLGQSQHALPSGPIRAVRGGVASPYAPLGASGALSARGPRAPLAPVRAASPRTELDGSMSARGGRSRGAASRGTSPSAVGSRASSMPPSPAGMPAAAYTKPGSLAPLRSASPRSVGVAATAAGGGCAGAAGGPPVYVQRDGAYPVPAPPPYAPPYPHRAASPRNKLFVEQTAAQIAREVISSSTKQSVALAPLRGAATPRSARAPGGPAPPAPVPAAPPVAATARRVGCDRAYPLALVSHEAVHHAVGDTTGHSPLTEQP